MAAIVTAGLGLLLACAPGGGAAGGQVRLVGVSDPNSPYGFDPKTMNVRVGATVHWSNTSDAYHTVTFTDSLERLQPNGSFDVALPVRGDRAERRFDRAGTFFYYCQPHSEFMHGTIVVMPAGR